MQALSLMEFLAFPDEYRKFQEVKKVIARYAASSPAQYQWILDRLFDLTGKPGVGYRTEVVHNGKRIETLVPDPQARTDLFLELDGYIRHAVDHMIEHSDMAFKDYLKVRDGLRPF